MATRPSELFAISAVVLLVLSFLSRLQARQTLLSINVGNTGYGFPPSTVFLAMASLLCLSATIYAIWPLRMNLKAGVWHYWMTAIPIAVYWICFYLFAFRSASAPKLSSHQTAAVFGQFVSLGMILPAQAILVANLILAVLRLRNASPSS